VKLSDLTPEAIASMPPAEARALLPRVTALALALSVRANVPCSMTASSLLLPAH
jgi:hypothetical protein